MLVEDPVFKRGCLILDSQGFFPFSFFFKGAEHLKVNILLASSIIPSPVEGFLPLRSFLSFTQNFPKPLIRMSSPFANVAFMISRRDPTSSADLDLDNLAPFLIESVRWALVMVNEYVSPGKNDSVTKKFR